MKKIILITGCSSGLGHTLAKKLGQNSIVYASMRGADDLQKWSSNPSESIFPIQLDVTDPESIEKALDHIKNEHGRLDILVNNAGVLHLGCFEDVSMKAYKDLYETNFFGVLEVTKRSLPLLKKSQEGKIINISSSSCVAAMPSMSAYASSKWAVEGFSESLRFELRPFGIQVLLIEPGIIRTKMVKENFKIIQDPHSDAHPLMSKVLEHWEKMPKEAFLDVEEVARVIQKRIEMKKPPFRTLLSRLSTLKLIVKRLLPFSWYEKILSLFFGL